MKYRDKERVLLIAQLMLNIVNCVAVIYIMWHFADFSTISEAVKWAVLIFLEGFFVGGICELTGRELKKKWQNNEKEEK